MKNQKVEMVKANKADSTEMKELLKDFPDVKIPTEIAVHNKTAYNFLGINTKKKKGQLKNTIKVKLFTKDPVAYKDMSDNQKDFFAKMYEKVVMLHDPTKLEEKKEGNLTKAKKAAITKDYNERSQKEGFEVASFIEEMAVRHNAPASKVKEHVEGLAAK